MSNTKSLVWPYTFKIIIYVKLNFYKKFPMLCEFTKSSQKNLLCCSILKSHWSGLRDGRDVKKEGRKAGRMGRRQSRNKVTELGERLMSLENRKDAAGSGERLG